MKKWKIYIVAHKKIHDCMYKADSFFNKDNYTIFNVADKRIKISKKYSVVNQTDLSNYQQLGKWWAESEAIYNIYYNKELYKDLDYIGFIHYDKELRLIETNQTNVTQQINEYLLDKDNGHVCLELHNTVIDYNQRILADIDQPNTLVGDGKNCYDYILEDYNNYFKTNYTIEDFLNKKNINLCSCFLIDINTFEKMMGFINNVILSKRLEVFDTNHQYRIQGGLMERYFGLFLTFEFNTFSDLSLYHHYNKGLK